MTKRIRLYIETDGEFCSFSCPLQPTAGYCFLFGQLNTSSPDVGYNPYLRHDYCLLIDDDQDDDQ